MTWLTYADLAQLTGVSVGTLRQWKARGKLPEPVKVGSATVWADTLELREWLEKRGHDERPDKG